MHLKSWFFSDRPLHYVIKQQRLQWAVHVVLWVANTYLNVEAQIALLCEARDHIGAHWIKHTHSFQFIIFFI